MKRLLPVLMLVVILLMLPIETEAVSEDYNSMLESAIWIDMDVQTEYYFSSDYQAWFAFSPAETDRFDIYCHTNSYFSATVRLYDANFILLDSASGYDNINYRMEAGEIYYLLVDIGQWNTGHSVYLSFNPYYYNIASSYYEVTLDYGYVWEYIEGDEPICPEVTVYGPNGTLYEGYYQVSYENNEGPGIGTVIVEGYGSYFGTVRIDFTIVAHEHEWYEYDRDEATCYSDGWVEYYCYYCDHSKEEVIPMLGYHDFTEWEINDEPTCYSAGEKARYCRICYTWEYEEIPKREDHNWSEWDTYESTCNWAGYQERYCYDCYIWETIELPLLEHQYVDWMKYDSYEHYRYCELCYHYENEFHNWDSGKVTKKATCKESGVKTYTCADCGMTETEAIAKLTTHTWDEGVVTKQPTCREEGKMYYTCTVCSNTKEEAVPANGHDFDEWALVKAPTTTSKGQEERRCQVCGVREQREIDKLEGGEADPDPTPPAPTEPIPGEPVATDPVPTDPIPTDPIPTEPAPTEPSQAPSEPEDTPVEPTEEQKPSESEEDEDQKDEEEGEDQDETSDDLSGLRTILIVLAAGTVVIVGGVIVALILLKKKK